MKFGLSASEYQLLIGLLSKPLKDQGAKVWIFGSRARGDFKPFSDIDLMYDFPENFTAPSGLISRVREDLENSNLPYKVDLVKRSDLAESYRTQIELEKVEI